RGWATGSGLLDRRGALALSGQILPAQPQPPGAPAQPEAWPAREPQQKAAVDVLLTAYRTAADAPKLAELLAIRIGASADAFERKQLLIELAGLHEPARDR